ncbi:hypothetical protein NL50_03550 [Clostridium acetobutylicum]|nr:hypothetical protein NL50_03550 [Clostridium acetobutylicum]
MKFNDEKVKEIVIPFMDEDDLASYYCYGIVTATRLQMFLLGSFSGLANKQYLLTFTNKKLIMTRMGMSGKLKGSEVIEYTNIKSAKISNLFFVFGKKIKLKFNDGSKVKFNINRRVMGIKKQGENLQNICQILREEFAA